MKFWKKLSIFVILSLVVCMTLTAVAFAADSTETGAATEANNKLDMNMSGENMTLGERFEYAMQGTATGMLMVFGVLGLLWGIVSLSKVVFYDIPRKKAAEKENETKPAPVAVAEKAEIESAPVAVEETATDDGELAAVITAAIAAMIESGDYKNEFVGGFRVVSFKRASSGAWNRK